MQKIQLLPGETMAAFRRRQALWMDSLVVASIVRQHPGISSKDEIALATGFDTDRVIECLHAIQRNETPFTRVDYGKAKAKGGPHAGHVVTGWFPMTADYRHVMEYADWHSSRVEIGVRRSRLERLMWAQGLTGKQATAVVATIEDRMKVPVEKLTAREAKTFERLANKQAIQVIKNGSL
jgi:hypothetical protein